MILNSHQDTNELSILINSSFAFTVTIKLADKSTKTFNNIDIVHWLDSPTTTSLSSSLHKFYIEIENNTFYWLEFKPATKLETSPE